MVKHLQGPRASTPGDKIMARITFGPMIVAASGKVGDTVFSRWKGRPYIRSRVTPANPKTALQVKQRTRLTNAVLHWQNLPQDIKDRWGEYASPYAMSGYNKWCDVNIPAMWHADDESPLITPANKDLAGPTDFAAVTGVATKEIDCTWTEGYQAAGVYIEIFAMKEGVAYYDIPLVQYSHEAVLASVEAATITVDAAAEIYAVMACIVDTNLTEDMFSQGYTEINVESQT